MILIIFYQAEKRLEKHSGSLVMMQEQQIVAKYCKQVLLILYDWRNEAVDVQAGELRGRQRRRSGEVRTVSDSPEVMVRSRSAPGRLQSGKRQVGKLPLVPSSFFSDLDVSKFYNFKSPKVEKEVTMNYVFSPHGYPEIKTSVQKILEMFVQIIKLDGRRLPVYFLDLLQGLDSLDKLDDGLVKHVMHTSTVTVPLLLIQADLLTSVQAIVEAIKKFEKYVANFLQSQDVELRVDDTPLELSQKSDLEVEVLKIFAVLKDATKPIEGLPVLARKKESTEEKGNLVSNLSTINAIKL